MTKSKCPKCDSGVYISKRQVGCKPGGRKRVVYLCSTEVDTSSKEIFESSTCKDRQISALTAQNQELREVLGRGKPIIEVVKNGHFETVGYMADKPDDKTYSWRIQADFKAVKEATALLIDIERLEKGEKG